MKVAIIGAGVSGLTSYYLLAKKYDVTLFEAENYLGGHANTIQIQENEKLINLDTGFIVCNKVNYPNFINLMKDLNIRLQPSQMSFSVSDTKRNFEYNASSLKQLLSGYKNLLNPAFYRMLNDIRKFNNTAKKIAQGKYVSISIQELIRDLDLGEYFYDYYLLPMISSIWSCGIHDVLQMPAYFICSFFENHCLLDVTNNIKWYTIEGGSQTYVEKIVNSTKGIIKTGCPVKQVVSKDEKIFVKTEFEELCFDKAIIATHSDQALGLLSDLKKYREQLQQIKYSESSVIIHTDISLLPKNRKLWASWNYKREGDIKNCTTVTYNLNILQDLSSSTTYCVSLNLEDKIKPERIICKYKYSHPLYNADSLLAQEQIQQLNGLSNIYLCGAYLGKGFHEDGVNSSLRVINLIDRDLLCKMPFTVV